MRKHFKTPTNAFKRVIFQNSCYFQNCLTYKLIDFEGKEELSYNRVTS